MTAQRFECCGKPSWSLSIGEVLLSGLPFVHKVLVHVWQATTERGKFEGGLSCLHRAHIAANMRTTPPTCSACRKNRAVQCIYLMDRPIVFCSSPLSVAQLTVWSRYTLLAKAVLQALGRASAAHSACTGMADSATVGQLSLLQVFPLSITCRA